MEMCNILSLTRDDLPVIWDADFLLGPKDDDGNDSYVLCEINISSVFPIPDEAVAPLCKAATDAMVKSKQSRPRPRA